MSEFLTEVNSPLNKLEPGFHQGLKIVVNGIERKLDVFIPPQYFVDDQRRRHGIIVFGGWTLRRTIHPLVEQLNNMAKKFGLLILYPAAQPRVFGCAHNVWSAEGTLASYPRRKQNDVQLVRKLISVTQDELRVSHWTMLGYGPAGGQFALRMAHERLAGPLPAPLVNRVVSVGGTCIADHPPPAPGVRLVTIDKAALSPYSNVADRALPQFMLKVLLMRWKAHPTNSSLQYQVRRFGDVNRSRVGLQITDISNPAYRVCTWGEKSINDEPTNDEFIKRYDRFKIGAIRREVDIIALIADGLQLKKLKPEPWFRAG